MAQTITNALTTCGVFVDTTGLIVNGNNAAEMMAADVFNNNLNTCVDINFSELKDNWKTYIRLTVSKDVSGSDLETRSTSDNLSYGQGKNQ